MKLFCDDYTTDTCNKKIKLKNLLSESQHMNFLFKQRRKTTK